ncbi:MAG: DEAD/DEAH box helicase family protein [Deltaproteobacteria bacterium]|nr:DEAD/DEAH box helicase family protein [Deltaproteobacteria bacterium]
MMTSIDIEKELDYRYYYQRVIDQQLEKEEWFGLKLVVGPTGMGKTSAIPNVIKTYQQAGCEKRFIYTSHRHLLIQEMYKNLCDAGIPCVYLKNDEDVVRDFMRKPNLADFLNRLDGYQFFHLAGTSRTIVEKQISSIKSQADILSQMSATFR